MENVTGIIIGVLVFLIGAIVGVGVFGLGKKRLRWLALWLKGMDNDINLRELNDYLHGQIAQLKRKNTILERQVLKLEDTIKVLEKQNDLLVKRNLELAKQAEMIGGLSKRMKVIEDEEAARYARLTEVMLRKDFSLEEIKAVLKVENGGC